MIALFLALVLDVRAAPGSKATIDFTGNSSFTPEKLRDALALQISDINSSGLTPALADDAAFYLATFYRKQGFPKVDVTFRIQGSRLTLVVHEGPKITISSLTFVGNHAFSEKTLYEFMVGVEPKKLASAKLAYTESDVAAGVGRVRDYYQSEGYLDAEVDANGTKITDGGTHAALVVKIVEGPRYEVGEVHFTGQPIFDRQQLLEALALKSGSPFAPRVTDDIERTLRGFYRGKGYYNAHVSVAAKWSNVNGGPVPIAVDCRPGPQFRIGKVMVRGTDRLKPGFMEKRFEAMQGRVYDPTKIEQRYRELLKTGMFRSLQVRPIPEGNDVLNLDVAVEEAKAKQIGFEIGYGTYDGMIGGITLADLDFMGTGRSLSLSVQYSQRGLQGELVHMNPWFLDSDWSLRSSLYSVDREEISYSKLAGGVRLDFKRNFSTHLSGGAYVVAEKTDVYDLSVSEALAGPTNYLLGAGGVSAMLDYRDDLMNPTRGWVLSASADVDTLDGELAFYRASLRYSWYRTFHKTIFALGARAGWIIPTGSTDSIPIDQRYFNGGSTTVRSFAERELGPKDVNGEPIGGELYTVFNAEWDVPVAGALGVAVFVDAGSLSSNGSFAFEQLRYAIGLGLRYQLPIGPIRIDYGYNPSPRVDEEQGAFHLSFGFAF